jgi:signal transduction histidine kinase
VVRGTGRALALPGRLATRNADVTIALVAALLFAIAWPTLPLTNAVTPSLLPVVAFLEVGPLLVARVRPLLAWGLALAVGAGFWASRSALPDWAMPWPVVYFLVLLALLVVVCLRAPWPEVLIAVGGTGAFLGVVLDGDLKNWAWGQAALAAVALLVRWLILSRRQLARETELGEAERARRAVLEERSMIARELHDVVAHHMSLIVVQAQSAPYRLSDVDAATREEFTSIERSARAALTEVRGVLGVLRSDDGERLVAPVPGGADVASLLASAQAAGMPLTWDALPVTLGEVPAAVGLAAYRIVQESLSNASRHAPGQPCHVRVELDEESLHLFVANVIGAPTPSTEASGGSGLVGMRTRAEAVGGELTAGREGDHWQVSARLPLAGARPAGA